MNGRIARWECPRGCGFFREWHAHDDYLQAVVDHPLYGQLLGIELVQIDIGTHTCRQGRLAHSRAKAATLAREELPVVYPKHGIPIYSPYAPRGGMETVRSGRRLAGRLDRAVS